MQSGSSFDQLEQVETAGSRRRRLRLYPRLAKGETGKGGPSIGGVLPTVEELLSGHINKGNEKAEIEKGQPVSVNKKVIEIPDISQEGPSNKEVPE